MSHELAVIGVRSTTCGPGGTDEHSSPEVWVTVASEASLGSGEVIGVEFCGRRWVVWRTESGVVAAAPSRCPHQWADLADGFVDGEDLVCAEHHWRFDTEGSAWKVNVRGRRDRKGCLPLLPVRRREGNVEVGIRLDAGDPP